MKRPVFKQTRRPWYSKVMRLLGMSHKPVDVGLAVLIIWCSLLTIVVGAGAILDIVTILTK